MDETLEFPKKRILCAHAEGQKVLRDAKVDFVETPEVALAVERHRWHWKPKKISCVLIAESHVYTSSSDFDISVDNDRLNDLPSDLPNPPTEFVRLVYCLGYGNNCVLTKKPELRNSGTWQFWKLFGAITQRNPYPAKGKDCQKRLAWQIETLQELRRRGIWLLDSSLHGIYVPGGERVNNDVKDHLHRIWWNCYGKWLLEQVKYKKVWAIGKGVHSTLTSLGVKLNDWIYQPNARNIRPEERDGKLKDLIAACCPRKKAAQD